MNHDIHNGRNVASLLSEMKDELKDFIQTRVAMFKAELQEKVAALKSAAPLAIAGLLLLGTAYLTRDSHHPTRVFDDVEEAAEWLEGIVPPVPKDFGANLEVAIWDLQRVFEQSDPSR